jgi:ADP-ribosylglycohydrolase
MDRLVHTLRSNATLTHRDPFIAGQSVAFGLIVAGLIAGAPLAHVHRWIINRAKEEKVPLAVFETGPEGKVSVSFTDALLQPSWSYEAAHDPAIRVDPAASACRLFGLACTLGFLLPAAYYFASRFEKDFYGAVMSALNGGGNNMARAALTGALSGAQVGLSGIPEYLIEGLRDHERLIAMAKSITK